MVALSVVRIYMNTKLEWHSLRLRLEALKETVAEEIRSYPLPIAACDTHFNRLLELRSLLPKDLARLNLAENDQSISIEDFIRSLPCEAALSEFLPES